VTQAQNTNFIDTKYKFPVPYSELNDVIVGNCIACFSKGDKLSERKYI